MINWFSFNLNTLKSDLVAGLTNALVYISQGIAYALVAGVNPVFGLYTGIIAPILGALTAGSSFLVINDIRKKKTIVTHFRQLRVYQEGFAAAMKIFNLSKSWPMEERSYY